MVAKALNAQPGDDSRDDKQIVDVAKEHSFGNWIKPVSGRNKRNSKYLDYAIRTTVYEDMTWSYRLMKIKI